MLTLHNCWPGDRSSKGCLEKQREHAKSACILFVLIFSGYLEKMITGYVTDWQDDEMKARKGRKHDTKISTGTENKEEEQ